MKESKNTVKEQASLSEEQGVNGAYFRAFCSVIS